MNDPLVYARAVHFAATILAAGTALFLVVIAEPAFAIAGGGGRLAPPLRRRLAVLALIGLVLALASGAVWLVFTAASMSGEPLPDVLTGTVLWTVLTDTTFGNDWLVRLVLAALLSLFFLRLLRGERRKSRGLDAAAALLAAAFAGSLAWSGHGAGGLGSEALVHPAADLLHLVAAAAWLGALLPLALLLRATGNAPDTLAVARAATLRFSTLGVVSVGTLLVTGIVNSWYLVGSIAALTGTEYGRLLIAKIALFLVMVAIAAVNRLYLTPRLTQSADAALAMRAVRQLRRNAMLETLIGAAVLILVAFLGTLPPASHAGHHHPAYGALPEDAAFVHIHSEDGMADVTVEPGRVGTAHATIHLWTADLETLNAERVTITLTPPAPDAKPVTFSAIRGPDDTWQADRIALPEPGNWAVVVKAELSPGKELVLDAPIVIDAR